MDEPTTKRASYGDSMNVVSKWDTDLDELMSFGNENYGGGTGSAREGGGSLVGRRPDPNNDSGFNAYNKPGYHGGRSSWNGTHERW